MGIRFSCPNGHKLNVKEHLAGKRGICPECGVRVVIPGAAAGGDGGAVVPAAATLPDPDFAIPAPAAANGPGAVVAPGKLGAAIVPPVLPSALPAISELPDVSPGFSVLTVQNRRRQRVQVGVIVVLLTLVVLLTVVLVWVLNRNANLPEEEKTAGRPAASAVYRTAAIAEDVLGRVNS
jgi:hypothetical protein